MAETPCKLLRYLVSDGSHVDADSPYAEVEVMKMCMPLLSPASGVIQFKMSEGQAMQVSGTHTNENIKCYEQILSKKKNFFLDFVGW